MTRLKETWTHTPTNQGWHSICWWTKCIHILRTSRHNGNQDLISQTVTSDPTQGASQRDSPTLHNNQGCSTKLQRWCGHCLACRFTQVCFAGVAKGGKQTRTDLLTCHEESRTPVFAHQSSRESKHFLMILFLFLLNFFLSLWLMCRHLRKSSRWEWKPFPNEKAQTSAETGQTASSRRVQRPFRWRRGF